MGFHKDNFQLPSFPFNFDFIMNMKLLSYDINVWKANVLMLWNVLEYPFYLYFLCMGKIDVLQNYFNGAKMIVGNSPRVYSKVNLRKVWLSQILIAGFIIYFDSLLAIIDQYYPAILTNPVTPHLRSLCLWLNGKFYNILTAVFLNSKKYYFSLILLAAFQAYSDHDFDVTTKFQDWFLNSDGTTGLKTRFVYTYGFEMASHLAFLVLAVKNPTNRWLWLLVNANFFARVFSHSKLRIPRRTKHRSQHTKTTLPRHSHLRFLVLLHANLQNVHSYEFLAIYQQDQDYD